jgi:hypothetical protein
VSAKLSGHGNSLGAPRPFAPSQMQSGSNEMACLDHDTDKMRWLVLSSPDAGQGGTEFGWLLHETAAVKRTEWKSPSWYRDNLTTLRRALVAETLEWLSEGIGGRWPRVSCCKVSCTHRKAVAGHFCEPATLLLHRCRLIAAGRATGNREEGPMLCWH